MLINGGKTCNGLEPFTHIAAECEILQDDESDGDSDKNNGSVEETPEENGDSEEESQQKHDSDAAGEKNDSKKTAGNRFNTYTDDEEDSEGTSDDLSVSHKSAQNTPVSDSSEEEVVEENDGHKEQHGGSHESTDSEDYEVDDVIEDFSSGRDATHSAGVGNQKKVDKLTKEASFTVENTILFNKYLF